MSLINHLGAASALSLFGDVADTARLKVPVTLSNKYATPTEEADALLKALKFTDADLAAYKEQHGVDLRQQFIDGFTAQTRAGKVKYDAYTRNANGTLTAYIGMDEAMHKRLTDFVAERHSSANSPATSAAQTAIGQEKRAYGDARRRQLEAQLPQSATAATTLALPAAQLGARIAPSLPAIAPALAEAAPIVALGTVAAAPAALTGAYLGGKYVEGQQASATAQAEAAQRTLEAQGQAEIQRIIESAPQTTTLPPFGNNEPLPSPPPLITPDRSEYGRKLSQPLTTPAMPPNVATSTPPFSRGQPLPPPPPISTPIREPQMPPVYYNAPAKATFGHATTTDYRKTFFDAYPDASGKVWVHHAVEQRVLKDFPGLVTEAEMHSLENLRGIPLEVNAKVHLSEIRKEWNAFYRTHLNPTKEQLLEKATEIDRKFGPLFNPPVKHEGSNQ